MPINELSKLSFLKILCLRCSFHAYADSTYAKHLENGASLYGTVGAPTPLPPMAAGGGSFHPGGGEVTREFQQSVMEMSDDSMNSMDQQPAEWGRGLQNGNLSPGPGPAPQPARSSPPENGEFSAQQSEPDITLHCRERSHRRDIGV